MNIYTATAEKIITDNYDTVTQFYAGMASGEYYNDTCWQIYLDTVDNSLRINQEADTSHWIERPDGSLIKILQVSGYDDRPDDERYSESRGDSLSDFGLQDWLDEVLTPAIIEILPTEDKTQ